VALFWLQNENAVLYTSHCKTRSSSQWGTQQENSATKHVAHRSSCNSSAWQSEWGFTLEFVDEVLLQTRTTMLHG